MADAMTCPACQREHPAGTTWCPVLNQDITQLHGPVDEPATREAGSQAEPDRTSVCPTCGMSGIPGATCMQCGETIPADELQPRGTTVHPEARTSAHAGQAGQRAALNYRPAWTPTLVATPRELAEQMRLHWQAATQELADGPDPRMATFLTGAPGMQAAVAVINSPQPPGAKMVVLQGLLDPDGPIHFQGISLDDQSLAEQIQLAHDGDEDALTWLETIQREHILTAFAETTGAAPAAEADYQLDRWQRQATALIESVTKNETADFDFTLVRPFLEIRAKSRARQAERRAQHAALRGADSDLNERLASSLQQSIQIEARVERSLLERTAVLSLYEADPSRARFPASEIGTLIDGLDGFEPLEDWFFKETRALLLDRLRHYLPDLFTAALTHAPPGAGAAADLAADVVALAAGSSTQPEDYEAEPRLPARSSSPPRLGLGASSYGGGRGERRFPSGSDRVDRIVQAVRSSVAAVDQAGEDDLGTLVAAQAVLSYAKARRDETRDAKRAEEADRQGRATALRAQEARQRAEAAQEREQQARHHAGFAERLEQQAQGYADALQRQSGPIHIAEPPSSSDPTPARMSSPTHRRQAPSPEPGSQPEREEAARSRLSAARQREEAAVERLKAAEERERWATAEEAESAGPDAQEQLRSERAAAAEEQAAAREEQKEAQDEQQSAEKALIHIADAYSKYEERMRPIREENRRREAEIRNRLEELACKGSEHGRIDDDGTVFVLRPDGEEVAVGQWAAGNAGEGLAFFMRKYDRLLEEASLLLAQLEEGRATRELVAAVTTKLRDAVANPHVVGDLAALAALADRIDEVNDPEGYAARLQAAQRAEEAGKQRAAEQARLDAEEQRRVQVNQQQQDRARTAKAELATEIAQLLALPLRTSAWRPGARAALAQKRASLERSIQTLQGDIRGPLNPPRTRSQVWPPMLAKGERYLGTVKKTTDYGAFVSLPAGADGLLRRSTDEPPLEAGDRVIVEVSDMPHSKPIVLTRVEPKHRA